jgi:uncharacterized protein with HEPN domain
MLEISRTLLEDIVRACGNIAEDTVGMSLETFLARRTERQAVERNLEIIGEALIRLRSVDEETTGRIDHVGSIIGLRNRLAHGYDLEIDDEQIWETSQVWVPVLREQARSILS